MRLVQDLTDMDTRCVVWALTDRHYAKMIRDPNGDTYLYQGDTLVEPGNSGSYMHRRFYCVYAGGLGLNNGEWVTGDIIDRFFADPYSVLMEIVL